MKKLSIETITQKKLSGAVALLLCIAAVIACKKSAVIPQADPVTINPITDYEITNDAADAFKFSFKNLSAKFKRVEWRFGDDTLTAEINPTHIYRATGKYTVDLKTFSETGTSSRKMVVINIVPDSVVKITAEKTGVLNQIKFGVTAKAVIKSVLWTFSDVSPAVTSDLPNPVRTYIPGSFNPVTATVTTVNGSVVKVTVPNATTEGLVKEITQDRVDYNVSAENNLAAAENSTKLLDGDVTTKYTMGGKDGRIFTYPLLITVNYATPQVAKLYAVGNSSDLPTRDPKAWTVQGSNDGVNWEILDTRVMTKNFYDQMTALGATTDIQWFKQLFYYGIANPKPFLKYRWSISANWGDAAMQTNEFRLFK